MKKLLLLLLLIPLAYADISSKLFEAEKLIKEMKEANAEEKTPYLYGKVMGYYEGLKLYASYGNQSDVYEIMKFIRYNSERSIRGAYTNREPYTELIVFKPEKFFEEICDGPIVEQCYYEETYEKEEYLKLISYFELEKRIKFLRFNNAKYCAPEDFGKAEAIFNLISLELKKEHPSSKLLTELKNMLRKPLIFAEEKLRYAMKKELECIKR